MLTVPGCTILGVIYVEPPESGVNREVGIVSEFPAEGNGHQRR